MAKRGFSKLLVLVAIVGAIVALLPLVPLYPLKSSVELKLSETLGRPVTIESVSLNVMRGPHLVLTGLTAREDPAFGDGFFLRANKVRAGFDLIGYLRNRQIVIDSITLTSPQIDLIRNQDGVWSWTTLGRRDLEKADSKPISTPISHSAVLSIPTANSLAGTMLRRINIEDATVKLRDDRPSEQSKVVYKKLVLNAALTPQSGGDSEPGSTQAKGELVLQSDEDGEADRLKATLPFDLKIKDSGDSALSISGSIGPGPIETKNIGIGEFTLSGDINTNRSTPLTGTGEISINDLAINTINLSERVSQALKLDQIGDMSPGTTVTNLGTQFQISEGTVRTTGLKIHQLDGLGDADAPNGFFKIDSALNVNYAATVVLTPEATSRVKSMSSVMGLIVTILESNNRVSVPIDIRGDVRNPEIRVDVSRIF